MDRLGRIAAALVGLVLGLAGPALAQPAAGVVRLAPAKLLVRGADALPSIAAPKTPATVRINADLRRQDRIWLKGRAECLRRGKDSYIERGVSAPMLGPEFLSVEVRHDAYCAGAAHPNAFPDLLTYDLTTGAPANWAGLIPRLVQHDPRGDAEWGDVSATVTWPAAHKIYAAKVRAGSGTDREWWSECRELVEQGEGDFYIWPDAKRRGLVLEPNWMPHAAQACGDSVVFSPADLRRLGADRRLIRALEAARS